MQRVRCMVYYFCCLLYCVWFRKVTGLPKRIDSFRNIKVPSLLFLTLECNRNTTEIHDGLNLHAQVLRNEWP